MGLGALEKKDDQERFKELRWELRTWVGVAVHRHS